MYDPPPGYLDMTMSATAAGGTTPETLPKPRSRSAKADRTCKAHSHRFTLHPTASSPSSPSDPATTPVPVRGLAADSYLRDYLIDIPSRN